MDNQPNLLNQILIRQFMPSFKMIEKVIESCSKTIWAQRNIDPPIWQQVYHVLYGIDYWFMPDPLFFPVSSHLHPKIVDKMT